jgi:hypothetical protein
MNRVRPSTIGIDGHIPQTQVLPRDSSSSMRLMYLADLRMPTPRFDITTAVSAIRVRSLSHTSASSLRSAVSSEPPASWSQLDRQDRGLASESL